MKCPLCDTEMKMMGKLGYLEGLPKEINENFYECPQCRSRDSRYFKEFGYQRTSVKNNEWYYFNNGCWNLLEDNPSLRHPRRKVFR